MIRRLLLAAFVTVAMAVIGPWTVPVSADQGRSGADDVDGAELAEQAPADVTGTDEDQDDDEGGAGGIIRLVSGVAGLLLVAAGVILVYRPLKRGDTNEHADLGDRADDEADVAADEAEPDGDYN